jgi:hypothetical protein
MARAKKLKPVSVLAISDFEAHPVWEFTTDDETDDDEVNETWVGPVTRIPVEDVDGTGEVRHRIGEPTGRSTRPAPGPARRRARVSPGA